MLKGRWHNNSAARGNAAAKIEIASIFTRWSSPRSLFHSFIKIDMTSRVY